MKTASDTLLWRSTAAAAAVIVGWDFSGLDDRLAVLFGGMRGFPLREHWLFADFLQDGVKIAAWLVVLALCVGVWFPVGWLSRLPLERRFQLALTPLAAAFVVSLLKTLSRTSCPWSLAEFGGIAAHVSHWAWLQPDGGSGRCFPAGHASVGFAFIGGYFVFRRQSVQVARRWLGGALALGTLLGISQQIRGAHFMSHTLWTGLICWSVAWAIDGAIGRVNLQNIGVDFGEKPDR